MSESSSVAGSNIILFPRRRVQVSRVSDETFLTDYERLLHAFQKIRNPRTRALIIELMKASGARVRVSGSAH
jgi:hypothetical protein